MRKPGTLKKSRTVRIVVLMLASISAPASAQTFKSLFSFNSANGAYPYTTLVQQPTVISMERLSPGAPPGTVQFSKPLLAVSSRSTLFARTRGA
jgi:hypothetical protein